MNRYFSSFLHWLGEAILKMLNPSTVKTSLNVDIQVSQKMRDALLLWSRMYSNEAEWLSSDTISLSLPAAISSEVSRSVALEMSVMLTGGPRAEFLQAQLATVVKNIRESVEFGAAKGGLVFKPYVSNRQLVVDVVHADQFYPVAFDSNKNLTSCIFTEGRVVGRFFYTRLEYHSVKPNEYIVRNIAFKSDNEYELGRQVPLTDVIDWADIEPEATIVGVDRPLFAYFRYPLANHIDPSSPLGVSCYSRAVDLIQQADKQWERLMWEFTSAERAVFVDELAFKKDEKGRVILPSRRLYRTLESTSTEVNFFREWSPTIRQSDLLAGLDAILKRIEFTCGLAVGTLSDPNTVDKTATELKQSKQRTFATVADTQRELKSALSHLIWAMNTWASLEGLSEGAEGTVTVTYSFDDSIVVDKTVQFEQDLRAVDSQVMSRVEFRMRNYGETIEKAREMLGLVQDELGNSAGALFDRLSQ